MCSFVFVYMYLYMYMYDTCTCMIAGNMFTLCEYYSCTVNEHCTDHYTYCLLLSVGVQALGWLSPRFGIGYSSEFVIYIVKSCHWI